MWRTSRERARRILRLRSQPLTFFRLIKPPFVLEVNTIKRTFGECRLNDASAPNADPRSCHLPSSGFGFFPFSS